jgi:hypothetical protein
MPPSSSRRDCEAGEEDWAPKRAVKVNILQGLLSSEAHDRCLVSRKLIDCTRGDERVSKMRE